MGRCRYPYAASLRRKVGKLWMHFCGGACSMQAWLAQHALAGGVRQWLGMATVCARLACRPAENMPSADLPASLPCALAGSLIHPRVILTAAHVRVLHALVRLNCWEGEATHQPFGCAHPCFSFLPLCSASTTKMAPEHPLDSSSRW